MPGDTIDAVLGKLILGSHICRTWRLFCPEKSFPLPYLIVNLILLGENVALIYNVLPMYFTLF